MPGTPEGPAEAAFRAGDLAGALRTLQSDVRSRPQDARLRIFLAQLLMVQGQWERAQNQLNVVAELDADGMLMAQTYRAAIQCEQLRTAVFAGQRSPLVFGEPEPWIALLIQALALDTSAPAAAMALRSQAFDQAPASRGSANGTAFEWIADADSRLGPVLEVLLNAAYYWVPFHRIARIKIEAPADIRDLVWLPAQFVWSNGGEAMGLIPARYPGAGAGAGAGAEDEPALLMGRRTEWTALGEEQYAGAGQKVLATDAADFGVQDLREVIVEPASA
jgi:type VI secretion system protein ImpE